MVATDSAPTTARRCPMCGQDMTGRSPEAEVCGPSCRRERSRLLALISGRGAGPYPTVAAYLSRTRRPRAEAVQNAQTDDLREVRV